MRVALLARAAHPLHEHGGLERAVYHLAKHLSAKGVEIVLLTRPATREGRFPGEIVTVPYGSGKAGTHGRVLDRTLHYPRFAARLGEAVAELARAGRVDVVHAHGLTALGYGRLRSSDPTLRAPLVMNPHGMEEHKTRGLKRLALTRLRALSREAARLSDRVIATDEALREEVSRLLGVDASRVVVLPNGVDPDEIRETTPAEPERAAAEVVPDLAKCFPLLLSVGRLEAYKGFGDVLQALEILHARAALPARWAWLVVGEGSERRGFLSRLAKAGAARTPSRRGADFGSHVHVVGRVGEPLLHAIYERADLLVHAPRYEGSSLVTLEAMAHGLPVVATRAGGIPDKIVEGETGRLVEPGDVQALARAIEELAGDGALREKMGRGGRERAGSCFSWPVVAERTIALYEELLRARRT